MINIDDEANEKYVGKIEEKVDSSDDLKEKSNAADDDASSSTEKKDDKKESLVVNGVSTSFDRQAFEQKLQASKRKLQQGYEQIPKRKRMVKVVELPKTQQLLGPKTCHSKLSWQGGRAVRGSNVWVYMTKLLSEDELIRRWFSSSEKNALVGNQIVRCFDSCLAKLSKHQGSSCTADGPDSAALTSHVSELESENKRFLVEKNEAENGKVEAEKKLEEAIAEKVSTIDRLETQRLHI
ncbi:hypothetical protein FRX31_023807 [Thalictrum thalictroides]|uniref:Uncharacterized protein n=1 Tax=Thalictrum thalictroides TaxID=46969 RepID=A0A7J6VND1_THATH|nr:hypothetical protein FRX31_023807 [Thalictrum thalictroides]